MAAAHGIERLAKYLDSEETNKTVSGFCRTVGKGHILGNYLVTCRDGLSQTTPTRQCSKSFPSSRSDSEGSRIL